MGTSIFLSCLLCFIVVGVNAKPSIQRQACTEQLPFPHPSDCSKYLVCAPWGAQEMPCPPGTVFDPKIHNCNFPREGLCEKTVDESSAESSESQESSEESNSSNSSEESEETEETVEDETPQEDDDGEENEVVPIDVCSREKGLMYIIPSSTSCRRFIICVNGNPTVAFCPLARRYFDPATLLCTSNEKVCRQGVTAESTDTEEVTESENTTEEQSASTEEQDVTTEESTGEVNEEDEEIVEVASAGVCSRENGNRYRIPVSNSCRKYISCLNGSSRVKTCPSARRYFDPEALVCTNNEKVCRQAGSAGSTDTESEAENETTEEAETTTEEQSEEQDVTTKASSGSAEEEIDDEVVPIDVCSREKGLMYFIPSSTSCRRFIMCINGNPKVAFCPLTRRYFDPETLLCTSNEKVCSQAGSAGLADTEEVTESEAENETTEEAETTTEEQSESTEEQDVTTEESTGSAEEEIDDEVVPINVCSREKGLMYIIPSSSSCRRFIMCINGYPKVAFCPLTRRYFDPETLLCTSNEKVCSQAGSAGLTDTEEVTENTTEEQSESTEEQEVTTEETTGKVNEEGVCSRENTIRYRIPISNSCRKYISCLNGSPRVKNCPSARRYFDPETLVCTNNEAVCPN